MTVSRKTIKRAAMRLYQLDPVRLRREPVPYTIEGTHKFGLPGANCPECGIPGATGSEYPGVELPDSIDPAPYLRVGPKKAPGNVPYEVFEELRERVRHLFPPSHRLPAATKFGKFIGSARGALHAFAWSNWTVFAQRGAFELLQREGVEGLVGVETEIIYRGKKGRDLVELHAEPHVRISRACAPDDWAGPCAYCGSNRFGRRLEHIVIQGSSIPDAVDVFRGIELTNSIFATPRFVAAVERHGFEGIIITEVDVE